VTIRRLKTRIYGALLIPILLAGAADAAPWTLDLREAACVEGATVRLADVARGPLPQRAQPLVVFAGGQPGGVVEIRARGILRRLAANGLADGVRLAGAAQCRVTFKGREIGPEELNAPLRDAVAPLVPTPTAGAPASHFELAIPVCALPVTDDWRVRLGRTPGLRPGRNLLPIEIVAGRSVHRLTVQVVLHAFGEVPQPRRALAADTALEPGLLDWVWSDLATLDAAYVVGRETVVGMSAARTLTAGEPVRRSDLRPTPLVRSGDPVELRLVRGNVAVSVRGVAKRAGGLGQTIPVRNDLTGRVVNARVTGPGCVDWRPR
jgi:flagella basal body P-ring formation protein FlgA